VPRILSKAKDPRKMPTQEPELGSTYMWQQVSRRGRGHFNESISEQTRVLLFNKFQGLDQEEEYIKSPSNQEIARKA
jgi:hypothetical protein